MISEAGLTAVPTVTTTETTVRPTPQGMEKTTTVVQRVGFWEESPNVFSSMRLLCFMSMCTAIVLAGLAIVGIGNATGMTLSLAFLGASFSSKIIQKVIEPKG